MEEQIQIHRLFLIKNIDRIVNRGRKEHFVYGAVVKKNDKNLELEFGRGVIKLN
ncbi:hypothetical protein ACSXBU_17000 (plasmid) [Clostridium perfringens]